LFFHIFVKILLFNRNFEKSGVSFFSYIVDNFTVMFLKNLDHIEKRYLRESLKKMTDFRLVVILSNFLNGLPLSYRASIFNRKSADIVFDRDTAIGFSWRP
jgi:hypothetical protein